MKFIGRTFLLMLLLAFTLNACKEENELIQDYPENLINMWVQSTEESDGFYRPADFKNFPVSRYRQTYTFMSQNKCTYLVLAPNDAHYTEQGYWEYDQKQESIRVYKPNKDLLIELRVKNLTDDLLEIE